MLRRIVLSCVPWPVRSTLSRFMRWEHVVLSGWVLRREQVGGTAPRYEDAGDVNVAALVATTSPLEENEICSGRKSSTLFGVCDMSVIVPWSPRGMVCDGTISPRKTG